MKLYKYTSLEYIEDALYYGAYASRLEDANDPYEAVGIQYPDDYRIVCLTSSFRQMLMWSYYTKHRGCCIQYRCLDEDCNVVQKMEYVRNVDYRRTMTPDEVIESLYLKGEEWKHEREYRAVYYSRRDENSSMWKHHNDSVFLNLKVEAIYFGLYSEVDDNYFEALQNIKDWCNNTGESLTINKMLLKADRYELEVNKQYDYLRELENFT